MEEGRSTDKKKIGELLVQEGIITEEQLAEALEAQASQSVYKPLGEICREKGFLSRTRLRSILSKYQKQMLLGDILLKMGVVTDEQLKNSLTRQVRSRKKLGEVLVESGIISETTLHESLSIQLTVEKSFAHVRLIDRSLFDSVNVAFMKQKRVLPVSVDKSTRTVRVMMENPEDLETISDLEKMFRMSVEPVLLTAQRVDELIHDLFDAWGPPIQ
jgi:hypothetical protein